MYHTPRHHRCTVYVTTIQANNVAYMRVNDGPDPVSMACICRFASCTIMGPYGASSHKELRRVLQ